MSWTDERIELLRSLWEQGLTASQIAERLGGGISRNAVIGKAHRLGLKARPSPVRSGDGAGLEESGVASIVTESKRSGADSGLAERTAQPGSRAGATAKPERVTLLDLNDKLCKWPIGHPGEPDFHFCGKPAQPSFPYCPEHCAVAYQAQLPRRDRSPRPLPPIRQR